MKKKVDSSRVEDQKAVMAIDRAGEVPCTHAALRRAARQLGNLYDEALLPIQLKATQIGLLSQIERLSDQEGPTLQVLAEEMSVRSSALTHALRPLIRDGFVELHSDAHDKRTKHVALTARCRQRLEEGTLLWRTANNRVEAILGEEAAALLRMLANQVSSREFLDAYRSRSATDPQSVCR